MLAAYKKMKSGGKVAKQKPNTKRGEESYITGNVDFLDEQVFGKYVPQENEKEEKTWSAESELASLDGELTNKQFEASNLPEYIKESIRQNPLIDTSAAKAVLQEVDDKLISRMGGFEASKKILETLDANDRKGRPQRTSPVQTVEETYATINPSASSVDYSLIKQIVEDVVTKKVSALRKSLLTEGVSSGGGSTVSLVRLGDTFTFLDSDDNVYECKMIYKGKRKRK